MKKIAIVSLFVVLVLSPFVFASEFKVYPGAKIDEKTTKEANEAAQGAKMSNVKSTIYTTMDSFPKVTLFYKSMSKEYIMPRASGTSGKPKNMKNTIYMRLFSSLTTPKTWPVQNSG